MTEFLQYVADKRGELLLKSVQHLVLTGVSASAAILVGVPLGIVMTRWQRARGPATACRV